MKSGNLLIEYHKIKDLKPYEKNARKHTKKDIKTIVESIKEFGFNDPVGIWSDDNFIVEGHGRALAAQEIGMDEIPCIRLDHLTDEQRRAYALAHNKTAEMSDWDYDMLKEELQDILDIDMSDFGFEVSEEENQVIDDEPQEEHEAPARARYGEVYKLGNNYLMCGDCTKNEDIEKLVGDNEINLLVTDPPYNVDYTGKTKEQLKIKNDKFEDDDFLQFLKNAFYTANKKMKDGTPFYIWHVDHMAHIFRDAIIETGWKIHETLIWNKNSMVLGHLDYHKKHEPCFYGWKEGAHYFTDDRTNTTILLENIPDYKNMNKKQLINLIEEIYKNFIHVSVIDEKKPNKSSIHPTMKPINLIADHVKNSSKKNENVLDIFGGSGTTLIVCEQLERNCFMMELDPKYIDAIIQRWEQFTGNTAVLISE